MKERTKEKTVAIIATVIGGGCFLYLLAASIGLTNDFFSWDARNSGWGWKALTFVLLGVGSVLAFLQATDRINTGTGMLALTGLLIGLAFVASTGFDGTAGDIKQRITAFDPHGRVADTTILYRCYEDFYHFNSNPELKQYIRDWQELPGRNTWNAYILLWLRGDTVNGIKPSTAPRANENFQWHTDAYELKIPKGCGK